MNSFFEYHGRNGTMDNTRLDVDLWDLPGDILGVIICPEAIGEIGCTMIYMTSKKIQTCVNPKYVLGPNRVCEGAAAAGCLNILIWAQSSKFPCNDRVSMAAAANGHVHILEHTLGKSIAASYMWNNLSEVAALNNHVNVIKLLIGRGCRSWSNGTFINATIGGHLELLKFLYSTSYWIMSRVELCVEAARYGHVHILKWLCRNNTYGCGAVVDEAIECDQPAVLDWWVARRGEIDLYDIQHIIPLASERVVQWFIDNGYPILENVY